jgi:hypothetical protein
MTLVSDGLTSPRPHVGELRLRRFQLGELPDSEREEVARHTAACGACRLRLDGLGDEQRAFAQEIPFARFAGGVERARRVPGSARPEVEWSSRPRRRAFSMMTMGGLAAAAALVLAVGLPRVRDDGGKAGAPVTHNNLKGAHREGSARIAATSGEQRTADPMALERLQAGERVRLGYRSDAPGFVAALSIDDAGVVTPLYPEAGPSLAAAVAREPAYLPDALELTGHGRERVYVVLSEQPFTVEALGAAVRTAYEGARGDLAAMTAPAIGAPAAISSWLFAKP